MFSLCRDEKVTSTYLTHNLGLRLSGQEESSSSSKISIVTSAIPGEMGEPKGAQDFSL